MNKHTPGPWTHRAGVSGNQFIYAPSSPKDPIAGVCILRPDWQSFESGPANARLIAAAPDLLAALEEAEFLMRKLSINPKEIGAMIDSLNRSAADARAVIAKARGE